MRATRRSSLALLVATAFALGTTAGPAAAQGKDVVVFAAASVKNALDEIATQWQRGSGRKAAQAFLSDLRSPAARAAFERQGFTVLASGGQRS
jgi:ABC-type molybdate transport system substrate-binding protein